MATDKRRRLGAAVLSLLWLLTSCTSIRPLENIESENLLEKISTGDVVIITTKDGKVVKTRVEHLTKETITGKNISVAVSDISEIKIKQFDGERTTGLTVLIVVGAVVIVAGIVYVLEKILLLW